MSFLYFVLQSSLLILLVLIIQKVGRKRLSPVLLYALWLIPLIRLCVPFGLNSINLPQNHIMNVPYVVFQQTVSNVSDKLGIKGSEIDSNQNLASIETPLNTNDTLDQEIALDSSDAFNNNSQINNSQIDKSSQVVDTQGNDLHLTDLTVETSRNSNISIATTLWMGFLIIWASVSVVLFSVMLIENYRIRHQIRFLTKAELDELQLNSSRGIRIAVFEGKKNISPCLFGIVHPCIILTKSVYQDRKLLKYVILHEQMHLKHKDQIWSFLRVLAIIAYWWNPLVWIAASKVSESAEYACDASLITDMNHDHRKEYGLSLLKLVQLMNHKQRLLVTTSMLGDQNQLEKRIKHMIGPQVKTAKAISIPLIVLLCVTMMIGCNTSAAVTTDANEQTTQAEAETSNKEKPTSSKEIQTSSKEIQTSNKEIQTSSEAETKSAIGEMSEPDTKINETKGAFVDENRPMNLTLYVEDLSRSAVVITGYQILESGANVNSSCVYALDCKYYSLDGTEIPFTSFVATLYKYRTEQRKALKCSVDMLYQEAQSVKILDDVEIVESYQ